MALAIQEGIKARKAIITCDPEAVSNLYDELNQRLGPDFVDGFFSQDFADDEEFKAQSNKIYFMLRATTKVRLGISKR